MKRFAKFDKYNNAYRSITVLDVFFLLYEHKVEGDMYM